MAENFIAEVQVFVGIGEIVHHHNVGVTLVVELVYQATPDKSSGPGYYNHDKL